MLLFEHPFWLTYGIHSLGQPNNMFDQFVIQAFGLGHLVSVWVLVKTKSNGTIY